MKGFRSFYRKQGTKAMDLDLVAVVNIAVVEDGVGQVAIEPLKGIIKSARAHEVSLVPSDPLYYLITVESNLLVKGGGSMLI